MTEHEAQWLACTNPDWILEYLDGETTSPRKLRLFAVACCRRVWHLLPEKRYQRAVLSAEAFADGLVTAEEMVAVRKAIEPADYDTQRNAFAVQTAQSAAWAVTQGDCWRAAYDAACKSAEASVYSDPAGVISGVAIATAYSSLTPLLRDIFNPFCYVTLDPCWLNSTVLSLAETIYNGATFDAMPILADALEEANCPHADILYHCRLSGEHVRGCWVVDLILGKK